MKRVWLFLPAIFLAVFCSCKKAEPPFQGKEISFWAYTPAEKDGRQKLEEMVGRFNSNHSDIRVKLFLIPKNDFNTKLNTAIAVGGQPDCFYLDSGLVTRFAGNGILLALNKYLQERGEKSLKDFYPNALEMNRMKGQYYALPLNQTCIALFYNKDLIKEPPKTWKELIETAKKVYLPGKVAAFHVPRGDGWGAWFFPAFVASAGGSMLNEAQTEAEFHKKPGVQAMQLWKELLNYSPRMLTDSANDFELGRTAMMVSGPWAVFGIKTNFPKFRYGIALIPKQARYASNLGGESIAIYSKCSNPDAAWKFVSYLLEPENQLVLFDVTGNFPALRSLAKNPKFAENPDWKIFLEQMEFAVPKPGVEVWTRINDEVIAKTIGEVLDQNRDAAVALFEAAGEANAMLKEYGKARSATKTGEQ